MIRFLQSKWTSALFGSLLYLASTAFLITESVPDLIRARSHAASQKPTIHRGPSWTFHNPELQQLMEELKTKKADLDERAEQLNELEMRLQTEREELNRIMNSIGQMQAEFDRAFMSVEQQETANLKKLAKVYAAMDPDSAILILQEMEDEALVKILLFMREKETAPILEALAQQGNKEAKRAAGISEHLRLSTTPD